MKIVNTSAKDSLFVLCRSTFVRKAPGGKNARRILPGDTWVQPDTAMAEPSTVFLYRKKANGGRALFWKGVLPGGAIIDADPGAKAVRWNRAFMTKDMMARAKEFLGLDYGNDDVTLADLQNHVATRDPAALSAFALPGTDHAAVPFGRDAAPMEAAEFTDCQLKIAQVVMDSVMLIFGIGELMMRPPNATAQAATVGVLGGASDQAAGVQQLGAAGPTTAEQATAVFKFINSLSKATVIAVVKVIVSNLDLGDKFLFGALVALKIGAIGVTLGAATIPVVEIELGISALFLIKDIDACYDKCSWDKSKAPQPPAPVIPGRYLVDHQGHYLRATAAGFSTNPVTVEITSKLDETDPTYRWKVEWVNVSNDQVRLLNLGVKTSIDAGVIGAYATAPTTVGQQVTLDSNDQGGTQIWFVKYFQAPLAGNDQPNVTTGYILENNDSYGSLYASGSKVICKTCNDPAYEKDQSFFFRDIQAHNPNEPEQLEIGWDLEMIPNDKQWGYWNADIGNKSYPLTVQSGTLVRPDDPSYWSIVAMGKGDSTNYVYAMVRCWSDAAGVHIQAGLNAKNKKFPTGLQDRNISIAENQKDLTGIRLRAWIVDNFESEDDGDG